MRERRRALAQGWVLVPVVQLQCRSSALWTGPLGTGSFGYPAAAGIPENSLTQAPSRSLRLKERPDYQWV